MESFSHYEARGGRSPFSKSPSPSPFGSQHPPDIFSSPIYPSPMSSHSRNNSFSPLGSGSFLARSDSKRLRSNSLRNSSTTSATFAPKFIKSLELHDHEAKVSHIEGENDFSGKRYVWLRNDDGQFIQGFVVEDKEDGTILVQPEDTGPQRLVDAQSADRVNPAKFDKANDMAELTHLNEPSVVHNLHTRYNEDLIYTYSGLFLVTVNPYHPLPIYGQDHIDMYRGRSREDTKPHIFAVADEAFRNLVEDGSNQSILVTGESGAGKTENTKKVIQYLAAVATTASQPPTSRSGASNSANLSKQILRANPILEAFGNAQTVRNNNSSRFGKFIRIQFSRSGQIAGAFIDWYLLEKSRVVNLNAGERNYHVFYQLLRCADKKLLSDLLLLGTDISHFEYTKHGNDAINGVSDYEEWNALLEAFQVMGFSQEEQNAILRPLAAILHLGNIQVAKESLRADQATLDEEASRQASLACRLLGIELGPFTEALLHPRVKAGREWVTKGQTPEQVHLSLDALAKGIYERNFGDIVDRINQRLNRSGFAGAESRFIGVLDIAGFEIFQENSFEQLCINYTNEKLQQFFNHHMFVLEQEEYAREQIEWKFIDFGKDLQPTIDLIEVTNPIGIFSCLDEDSVMPKATDSSFTEKLHSLWDRKTPKYKKALLHQGFKITHYAADVEYSTEGWLEKNKDPLNDNITRLLASSLDDHIANIFADCAASEDELFSPKSRVKKGLFRTVAQRHKEQLSNLMSQLHQTHPHFVRCILPNHDKKPKLFDSSLVLDQLRCNGVLEGIRIARTGFPNRLPFAEFRSRYEILCGSSLQGVKDGQQATTIILEKLRLDSSVYRIGLTKVFFRAGVLAELEEQRDGLINDIVSRFQSLAKGFTQRRAVNKRLYRAEAARVIQKNFQVYLNMQSNPWWTLFVRMRPLLGATRQSAELKKRDEAIHKLEHKMQQEAGDRQKLDEARRKAEMEMSKIQQILESERALALDKEEIFKRLQEREAELNEKLAGALDDQDTLEDQIDELMQAKQNAEDHVSAVQKELTEAGRLVTQLEEEKHELSNQLSEIQDRIVQLELDTSRTSEAEESLKQEIRMLTSQLGMKDRKLSDLESKILNQDHDLETKLATSKKDLQASNRTNTELSDQIKTLREQLNDVSSTTAQYEDTVRLKESELSILRNEKQSFISDRKHFDDETRRLSTKHDEMQARLRDVQGELETSKSYRVQLEKEVADAKKQLQERMDEDAESNQSREILEDQIEDLKGQLYQVQTDLNRERQSRDDVQMLGEHKYNSLKRDYDTLNEAKITIEKELYVQQDVLRRTSEQRNAVDKERLQRQEELRGLRQRYLELQNAKLEIETAAEQSSSRIAEEKQSTLRRELEEKDDRLERAESECDRLGNEVQRLKQMMSDSDMFKTTHDQEKQRLERELVTVKGRLTASENDNRALLNKIQQKNLDIARSNSRASDSQRSNLSQVQNEKSRLVDQNKSLSQELEDARVAIQALEKQKEKLALNLEDLNLEIEREHKSSRNAEKVSSTVNVQLAEANRHLETERQLKSQAQTNSKAIQSSLDQAHKEIEDCHQQLILLQKVFNPSVDISPRSFDAAKLDISKTVDLARKLQEAENAAKMATERYARAEAQLEAARSSHEDEISQLTTRHSSSKRALLEELDNSQVNSRKSPQYHRSQNDSPRNQDRFSTPTSKPKRSQENYGDFAISDRAFDGLNNNKDMDLITELELLQNKLHAAEMRNRHLQTQIGRSPSKTGLDEDSPAARRMQKLEKENFRLHDMLDDSAKKVSALENSIRADQLTLKEVQTKSHEELFDLITSQEQSRRSLLHAHNTTVAELADSKVSFDGLRQARASLEIELRDSLSELDELKYKAEQDENSRSQLLLDYSDMQMKLDAETARLSEATSTMNLYKSRADDYYNKLEQAELAVLKASRAEKFAKSQSQEAEETCASIVAERKQVEATVEDLQQQLQRLEEKVEDMSTDLESTTQAKRRLQNELEDYRSQRAIDIEDKENSMENTRKKYQTELSTLTSELETQRETAMDVRGENSRLRDELENLRAKWDDEVLNSSTWAKEKSRLEMTLESLSNARDEAASAHNDAQGKVVSLLSQVRTLRSSLEDTAAERDSLAKEKKSVESRLGEANEKLEELSQHGSPSVRNAASVDRDLLKLKTELAQQQDIAAAAADKMRRSDALAQEAQKDIGEERETNMRLYKEKDNLEKTVKDLQLRLVDLETKGYSSGSQDVRFLHGRIQELEKQVEGLEDVRNKEQRSVRNVDRTVRDLQSQIDRREKTNGQLSEDINKGRDKIERLLKTIEDLQSSESDSQIHVKRAERELREEKEKTLRLERELEGWKALRMDRNELRRSGTFRAMSELSYSGSIRGRRDASETHTEMGASDPLERKESLTKNFL